MKWFVAGSVTGVVIGLLLGMIIGMVSMNLRMRYPDDRAYQDGDRTWDAIRAYRGAYS